MNKTKETCITVTKQKEQQVYKLIITMNGRTKQREKQTTQNK